MMSASSAYQQALQELRAAVPIPSPSEARARRDAQQRAEQERRDRRARQKAQQPPSQQNRRNGGADPIGNVDKPCRAGSATGQAT